MIDVYVLSTNKQTGNKLKIRASSVLKKTIQKNIAKYVRNHVIRRKDEHYQSLSPMKFLTPGTESSMGVIEEKVVM